MRPLRDDWTFNSKYCVADFDESIETSPEVAMGIATFERAILDFIKLEEIVNAEIRVRQNWREWHKQTLAGKTSATRRALTTRNAVKLWYTKFKDVLWEFLFLDKDREYNAYYIAEHCFSGDWYQTLTTIREFLKKHPSYTYSPTWDEIKPNQTLLKDTH